LQQRDAKTYEKIDRQNRRRVVRAVEVIRLTGKPFSQQRAVWSRASASPPVARHSFGLARAPADLHSRIEARVDQMFANGLVEETKALLKCGLENNRTAMQSLGYRQVVEYLRGERSLAETIQLIKIRTRQFAKRQMTWFRRQMPLQWVDLRPEDSAESAVTRILSVAPEVGRR
jgi:tRNA dimethylallyltransferase